MASTRLTFLLSTLWLSGGVRDIIEIANRLAVRGYKITVIVSGGTIDEGVRSEVHPSIEITETRIHLDSKRPNAWRKFLIALSMARTIPPTDVIITTQTPTTVPGLIGKIRHRCRLAWFYQDYEEMFLDRPVERWLLKNAFRWHGAGFVLSTASRDELLSFHLGRVTVVNVGLSGKEFFHPFGVQLRESIKGSFPTVLTLGDMRPRKGIYDFLKAMEILSEKNPDIKLWIVSKEELELPTRLPFEFFQRPSRKELATLYAACDVFVSASWWESFGIPPLEAMACGAPVVMTDSRGGREYARNGENCVLVPPQDPGALAEAVLEVLTNPELADRLRKNGPATAARFDWETTTDKFEQGLKDLLAQTPSR
jgi:glycosyltransferase involved in cell wall biosynthesis